MQRTLALSHLNSQPTLLARFLLVFPLLNHFEFIAVNILVEDFVE
jgi:hypothetical protein